MKYIDEINSFHDWTITNQIGTPARILWYSLMHYCNRTGWKSEFNLSISALELDTGLSKSAIVRARNTLQQYGRISFKARKGNQSTVYSLIPFACLRDTQSGTQTDTQSGTQTDTIPRLDKDETRLEEKEKSRKEKFRPPTTDEVEAYCRDRQNGISAERFVDYYTSNGWLVGKNKMKDWKAAVRTWERRDAEKPVQRTGGKQEAVATVQRLYDRYRREEGLE